MFVTLLRYFFFRYFFNFLYCRKQKKRFLPTITNSNCFVGVERVEISTHYLHWKNVTFLINNNKKKVLTPKISYFQFLEPKLNFSKSIFFGVFSTQHSVWKSQKKSHSTSRAKRATFTFWVNLASFWKAEACGHPVLPDRSVLIGQKLVENAKM